MAAKKAKAKKAKLQNRHVFTDVTDKFSDILNGEIPLSELKTIVDDLVFASTPDARVSTYVTYDEWNECGEWTWTVSEERLETPAEQVERIKQEKEDLKLEKKWAAQAEREEKREYLRLKKKFEGK